MGSDSEIIVVDAFNCKTGFEGIELKRIRAQPVDADSCKHSDIACINDRRSVTSISL